MQFLKKIGMNLLEIKDVIRTSLPVQIFEPKSYLQRVVDGFIFAPSLLYKASRTFRCTFRFSDELTWYFRNY